MLSLIVLAAGKSTRMRGRNKLLAKIDGKPIIRRIVEAALSSKVDEVIVVLGWQADKIRAALGDLPCTLVTNKQYEEGQSSSVKAGFRGISPATRAVLVLPGDVAQIDSASINTVIEGYNTHDGLIVIAAHKGKLGHPILISKELFIEVEEINEQTYGLKAVLTKHEKEIRLVETGSEKILRDVDTPDDLKNLK